MTKRLIKLLSQEDLKVYMSPQRQKLMRYMRIAGEAVTPKAMADMLNISASSVQFHIKKLEKLGIVELDHTEVINGIVAKFYVLSDVDVSIGMTSTDNLSDERFIVIENLLKNSLDGFRESYSELMASGISDEGLAKAGDFLNGAVHLSKEDASELLSVIKEFISTHEQKVEGTEPWEYSLIMYNAEHKK